MKTVEALEGPLREAEIWPLSVEAYHVLGEAGLIPKRTELLYGFVYRKNEETGAVEKLSKSLGNVVEPMEIITRVSSEAFRYYFLRECLGQSTPELAET